MKNSNIAKVLKKYRKRSHLSVREVAGLLHENSIQVAEKTIYGWENGQSQPDADTLMLLCEIYKIDNILSAFGYRNDNVFYISKNEMDLIRQFRKHPEVHEAILKLLDIDIEEFQIGNDKVKAFSPK